MSTTKKLKKAYQKIPVVWQFFCLYIIITSILIISLLPLYYRALAISKESYLKESRYTLGQSGMMLENTASAIWQIPQTMSESQYYRDLKLFRGNELSHPYYYYLYEVREFFSQQLYPFDFATAGFILFQNNGICVTNDRIFKSAHICFSEYIKYQSYEAQEIIDKITGIKNQIQILPTTNIVIGKKQNDKYMTLVVHSTGDSAIFGILFEQADILEMFNIPNLPEGSFFYIANTIGDTVFSYQYDQEPITFNEDISSIVYDKEEYYIIRNEMNYLSCEAVIGIPNRYFTDMLTPLRQMSNRYIVIALIIGVVLSLLFTFLQLLPVKKLLKIAIPIDNNLKSSKTNEFRLLEEVMQNASVKIKQLNEDLSDREKILRSNLLIRLLYGTIHLNDELNLLNRYIPQLADDCIILLVRSSCCVNDDKINLVCLAMHERLLSNFPQDCVMTYLDSTKTAILVPNTQTCIKHITKVIHQIGAIMNQHGILLRAGASDSFSGEGGARNAFFQAQIGLDMAQSTDIQFNMQTYTHDDKTTIDIRILQTLYELLIAGDAFRAKEIITKIEQSFISNKAVSHDCLQQTFYALRLIIELAFKDARYDICKLVSLQYEEHKTVQSLFDELIYVIELVAEEHIKRINYSEQEMSESILAYINENVKDPSLCVDSIVSMFCISRSYLYKVMKETLGKSVSEYIECKRMQKATELLNFTQMNIDEISSHCGYNSPNTFYKVFRKHYGVTPSVYRKRV